MGPYPVSLPGTEPDKPLGIQCIQPLMIRVKRMGSSQWEGMCFHGEQKNGCILVAVWDPCVWEEGHPSLLDIEVTS